MTLRRPLFVLLLIVAVAAAAFAALQHVRASEAHAHAEAEAAATRRWDAQLEGYLSGLSVPAAAHAVASYSPAPCGRSVREVCWATKLLPAQADESVVAAVIAAGARPITDPVVAGPLQGCGHMHQSNYPGNCAHLFSLPGGHVLVELFPHREPNANGQLVSFDGSEVIIQGLQTRPNGAG